MHTCKTTGLLVAAAVLVWAPSVGGQIGYLWTYEALLAKADLVVIARCQRTEDVGPARHPELKPGFPVVEMQTAFVVKAILKNNGNAVKTEAEVRLRHYRHDEARWRQELNVPATAPLGYVNAGSEVLPQLKRSYLLFLKAGDAGVYEPLSGHTFPTSSVFPFDGLPELGG